MKTLLILISTVAFSLNSYCQSPYIHHAYPKVVAPNLNARIDFSDIDNDGDEDLMNFADNYIARFFRSNGSGIDSLDYISVPYTNTTVLTDWNNDNLPDLLCNSASVKLIQNTGNFTFAPSVEISTSTLYNIDTANINADLYVDAFAYTNYAIKIFINNSGNPSTTNYSITTSHYLASNTAILFNDIENDGLNEMFVKAFNDKIYIYTQTGSMDYTLQDSIVHSSIGNVAAGSMYFHDLNNDGIKELITRDGWFIRVFEWSSSYDYNLVYSGDASYSVTTGFGLPGLSEISDFYDVDNNGYLDIVAGNSVFFNNNFSFNEVAINITPRLYSANYKCTDLNNNGKTDICYVYTPGNTYFEEAFYRTENTIGQSLDAKSLIWYNWGVTSTDGDVLDYDNDGDTDVISFNLGKMILWENINDTLYPKHGGQGLNYNAEYGDIVDINQDSYMDFLWSTATSSTDAHGYRINNGTNVNTGSSFVSSNMRLKLIADIDNDGIEELFYHLKSGSTGNYVYMYRLNTGVPVLATTVLYWTDYQVEDVVIRLADYNLDGQKDVFIQHQNLGSSKIRIAQCSGPNTFTAGQIISSSSIDELLGVFDSNGDLYPDIHWRNSTTRLYRSINSSGTFGSGQIIYTLPSGSFSSSTGYGTDSNNDGLTDIVIQNTSKQWIFKNTGTNLSLLYSGPASKNISRIMDIDGDGDEDLVANDTWYENTSISPYSVIGSIFYDVNTNGIFDSGQDILFPSFPVELNNNWYTSYTDNMGRFQMPLGSTAGNYNLSIGTSYVNQFYPSTVPYPALATVNASNYSDSVFIGVSNINSIVDGTLDVTLSGHRCNEQGRLFLQVQNLSPESVDIEVKLKLAENSSLIASNLPVSQISDTLVWQFSGIDPFHLSQFYVDINMPGTLSMGDTMHYFTTAVITGNLGTQLLVDTLNQILTCAYDPNDKNITMTDLVYLGDSTYSFTDETEYLIRFQNTGNDTAVNVVIKDQLTNLFDFSTIRPISASHDYNFSFNSNGSINVEFNNIQLPDSSTNFLGSMGYVKFKVDYKSTSQTFIPVNNWASIYFDQNPPIITNNHKFLRANCRDFINVNSQYSSTCFIDTIQIPNNDYGLPFNYEWTVGSYVDSTEDTGSIPLISSSMQSYSLMIFGFNCSADTTLEVIIHPSPNITLSTGDTSNCFNESMLVSSDQNVTWYLDNILQYTYNSFSFWSDTPHTVHCVATNVHGCSDTAEIFIDIVNAPESFHSMDNLLQTGDSMYVCHEDSIVVNSNFGTIEWSVNYVNNPQNDFNDTSTELIIPIDSAETEIILTADMEYLGCPFTKNTNIIVIGATNVLLSTNPGNTSIQNGSTNFYCNQEIIIVNSNQSLEWYYNGNYVNSGLSIDATATGIYSGQDSCGYITSFEIINQNESFTTENVSICNGSGYIAPDGTIYNSVTSPFTHISILENLNGCDSTVISNILLHVPSNTTDIKISCGPYTWIDGNTYDSSNNTAQHIIANSAGCDSVITLDLTINPLPNTTVTASGLVLTANQMAATYQWLDCDNNNTIISGEFNQTFTPTSSIGNYAVEINLNGCSDTSSCIMIDYASVNDLFQNILSLNPNPADELIIINGLNEITVLERIEILSLTGVTVRQFDSTISQLNVSDISPGEYLIRIVHQNGIEILRFIKK